MLFVGAAEDGERMLTGSGDRKVGGCVHVLCVCMCMHMCVCVRMCMHVCVRVCVCVVLP